MNTSTAAGPAHDATGGRARTTAPRLATALVRADAVVNVALAAVLVAAAAPLSDALGGMPPPLLYALAVVALANGVLLWRAGRGGAPAPGDLRRLAAIDLAFGVLVGGVALLDPTGAAVGMRWTLAGLAVLCVAVADAKWFLARTRRHAVAA